MSFSIVVVVDIVGVETVGATGVVVWENDSSGTTSSVSSASLVDGSFSTSSVSPTGGSSGCDASVVTSFVSSVTVGVTRLGKSEVGNEEVGDGSGWKTGLMGSIRRVGKAVDEGIIDVTEDTDDTLISSVDDNENSDVEGVAEGRTSVTRIDEEEGKRVGEAEGNFSITIIEGSRFVVIVSESNTLILNGD